MQKNQDNSSKNMKENLKKKVTVPLLVSDEHILIIEKLIF